MNGDSSNINHNFLYDINNTPTAVFNVLLYEINGTSATLINPSSLRAIVNIEYCEYY